MTNTNCARNDFAHFDAAAATKPTPAAIVFTENAANKVAELIAEENNPELKLRVYVEGGGCSGFQYGFTFDETTRPDDSAYVTNDVTLLVDAKSTHFLAGATIDYTEDMEGERFVIQNPNAKSNCSCGSSFDIE